VYTGCHNKYRNLKNIKRRRRKAGKDLGSISAKLVVAAAALHKAKSDWEAASKQHSNEQWDHLCASIEGKSRTVAWQQFRKTVPTPIFR